MHDLEWPLGDNRLFFCHAFLQIVHLSTEFRWIITGVRCLTSGTKETNNYYLNTLCPLLVPEVKVRGKGRALVIAAQVDTATAEALRYMARTKRRRTYLPYTFPAVAGTHLPTPRGWRVE